MEEQQEESYDEMEVDNGLISDIKSEIKAKDENTQLLNTNSVSSADETDDEILQLKDEDSTNDIQDDDVQTANEDSNDSNNIIPNNEESVVSPEKLEDAKVRHSDAEDDSQDTINEVENNDLSVDTNSTVEDPVIKLQIPNDKINHDSLSPEAKVDNKGNIADEYKISGEIEQETDQMNSTTMGKKSFVNSPNVPDFIGFDSQDVEMSLEKTNELIQILQDKEEELTRMNLFGYNNTESANADSTDTGEQSNYLGGNASSVEFRTVATQEQALNSRKPFPVHPVKGVPVNIFEDLVPTGSKRVKKKRTFFGDFEESYTEKAPRKSSTSRPNEEGVKMLNISGENKENFVTDDKLRTEPIPEVDTSGQNKAKRRYTFDISNPLFKEPFKHGWKREICYRNLPEGSTSKPAYVSYYNALGRKFKTIRQIVELLPPGSELSMKHFTFSVQRIFDEPSEFEILRDAKSKVDLNDTESLNDSVDISSLNQSSTQLTPSDHTKLLSKKKPPPGRLVIKKPKYLQQTESEDDALESSVLLPSAPTSSTPKIVIKGPTLNSSKSSSSKSKSNSVKKGKRIASKKSEKSSKKSFSSSENVDNSTWEQANSFQASSPSISKNSGDRPICTISCPLALGSVPTLQCTICLGLYHVECCDTYTSPAVQSYVCKSCRSRADVQSKLLLAVSESAASSSSSSNAIGYGGTAGSRLTTKNTKIVDGVTTWLPSSSNVQLSSRHTAVSSLTAGTHETTPTTLLQSVLELDGKRYIIVPKESIISISPNTNSGVNTTYSGYKERQNDEIVSAPQRLLATPTNTATSTSIDAEVARNYVVNSSEGNSAGVLLVPVMPSSNGAYCSQSERGSSKRKLSDESDTSSHKMMRLDDEWSGYRYHSALTLSNVFQLYDSLTLCFQYLTVRELLRVSMSCKYLNRIASEPSLWNTVRLKNSKVRDWEGFARTLRKYSTKKLDMRKMLCPSSAEDVNVMWSRFLEEIASVTSLEHIEFSRCNAHVVETVARTCPNLVVMNAVQLRNGSELSLEAFVKLKHLRELRLKGPMGLNIEPCNDRLDFQSKEVMQVLSLTSIKNMNSGMVEAIGDLRNLRILELGECNGTLMHELATSIGSLEKLERLRIEQITSLDPEFELFQSIKKLPCLTSLELINIEVKMGFCETITQCKNIKNLLIIPLYKTEAATSNRVIMDSLEPLSHSLRTFVWGLTYELMRVTDLYATQFLNKPKASNSDTKFLQNKVPDIIPMRKRNLDENNKPSVDLLSVKDLEKMLRDVLPSTRVKVITIAFASAWRQSLAESFK